MVRTALTLGGGLFGSKDAVGTAGEKKDAPGRYCRCPTIIGGLTRSP